MVRRLFRRGEGDKADAITDFLGRVVELTPRRWRHIIEGHPEMDGLQSAVKRAVERADERQEGQGEGVEKLYGRGLGPAKWICVVVRYEGARGTVLTAYPQTKDPVTTDD